MQSVNDNTEELRQKMADAGIPDFGVGVSVNGAGDVNVKGSYRGQEVFNTENIDRSNAEQVVSKKLDEVRQTYGDAWHASSSGGNIGSQ